jgi:hypothetical protein
VRGGGARAARTRPRSPGRLPLPADRARPGRPRAVRRQPGRGRRRPGPPVKS